VKDGDTLDLGNRTLKFISAPNLHWPDTIYTWLGDENILFTCDSFGAHYCRYEMSDDLNDDYLEAFKYYFDVILKPYSKFMLKAIEKIRPLDIKYFCPGHGPILSQNWKYFVDLTEKYAQNYMNAVGIESEGNILIAYVSAYGYTAKAAEFVAEGIREAADLKVKVVDIEHIGLDELQTLLISSRALLIGSPTINQNTLLPVYKLFALINPIRDRGKLCGSFGSYGWSGEAVKIILETMRSLKLRIFEETSEFKFMPSGSKEIQLRSFGKKFAEKFAEESAAE
ncbi:MAG: FprA family A-type flavoprotein, partial [Bacteroidales bacterium]|nr:FprA family A-type flavoprotein [Bacteroidales bacterium]